MFSLQQTTSISRNYFKVIDVSAYYVYIQSKNTGHYWFISCETFSTFETITIYHKHKYEDPLHFQCRAASLKGAIFKIKDHDKYQMRRNEFKKKKRSINCVAE